MRTILWHKGQAVDGCVFGPALDPTVDVSIWHQRQATADLGWPNVERKRQFQRGHAIRRLGQGVTNAF